MKKIILLLTLLLLYGTAHAQCPPGDVSLTTQQEVDDFVANYPNCTSINGNINIGDNDIFNPSDITNIGGLNQITSVSGNLVIVQNFSLSSLNGLNQLTSVGGDLDIVFNFSLTGLDDLGQLTSVGGNIEIGFNDSIDNLDGLNQLESVGKSIYLFSNASLTGISGLTQLTSIGASLRLSGNQSLTDISGLNNLTTIKDTLEITGNTILSDINSLENLNTSDLSHLEITNNYNLSLCNITSICSYLQNGGAATISDNALGCNNTTEILNLCASPDCPPDDIILTTQQEIDDFVINYPNCTNLPIHLQIGEGSWDPGDITNLNGLNQLTSTEGDLIIFSNELLTSLSGLSQLTSVGGRLTIFYNTSLTNLNGLEQLTSVGENLSIDSKNLTSLIALGNLSNIGGDLFIRDSDDLSTLTGLESLSAIGENLVIRDNSNLTALTGLENLNTIGNDLVIRSNNALTDISGIENIDHTTINHLSITYNSNLSFCGVENICTYIDNDGDSEILFNGWPCVNETGILIQCGILTPVELLGFQAQIQDEIALLTWQTATETNNEGFEIQRSRDGITWEKIAWQDGQGTTSSPHNYTHRDINPPLGISYYRLQQVDFDGAFEYSDAVSVRYARTPVSIYPNPVKDKLYIQTNEQPIEQVLIFDATGRQITASLTDDMVDVSGFDKGIYTIKITVKGEDFYEKIMID